MKIRYKHVDQSLETVRTHLDSILGYSGPRVIAQARSDLRTTKSAFDNRQRSTWGFRIDPPDPLVFRETVVDRLRVRIDLFMYTFWDTEPAARPAQLGVVIRVWSLDHRVYFRPAWDAEGIEERINPNKGRVILRLHFDLANPHQQGPQYHLQVGGNPRDDELHWFPKALSVPRLLHIPVDLVLATELIASTFYPSEYRRIRREDLWKSSTTVSQSHLLHGYFTQALRAVKDNESVLEALWNVPWRS